jgi:hypothetical protein
MRERGWGEWGEEIVDRETIELVERKGRQRRRWWFKVKVRCLAHVGTGLRKFHYRHFPDPDSDMMIFVSTCSGFYYFEEIYIFGLGAPISISGKGLINKIVYMPMVRYPSGTRH